MMYGQHHDAAEVRTTLVHTHKLGRAAPSNSEKNALGLRPQAPCHTFEKCQLVRSFCHILFFSHVLSQPSCQK